MIPVSTALWDPLWYHDSTKDYNYIFKDKRGILNGLRCECIIEQGRQLLDYGIIKCPCEEKNYLSCSFLQEYRKNLDKIDFNKMITDMENFANEYQKNEGFIEEPIIVLIVYETPKNNCSERQPLIDYFNSHGIECKELEYPIQYLDHIQNKPFEF